MASLFGGAAPSAAGDLPLLPLQFVKLGKMDLEWTQLGGYRPAAGAREPQSSQHTYAVWVEWDSSSVPVASEIGAQSIGYRLHPVGRDDIDLQHTVSGTQKSFQLPLPVGEGRPGALYKVTAVAFGAPPPGRFCGSQTYVAQSEPFSMQFEMEGPKGPLAQCALCSEADPACPAEAKVSTELLSPVHAPPTDYSDPDYSLKYARFTKQQALLHVANRDRRLDCRDVLFCGHSFHRRCIDRVRREAGHPIRGVFDVACPTCGEDAVCQRG